jgi:hypothetical protein
VGQGEYQPELESEYPIGSQNQDINAGDFKFTFDSTNESFSAKTELLDQSYSGLTR